MIDEYSWMGALNRGDPRLRMSVSGSHGESKPYSSLADAVPGEGNCTRSSPYFVPEFLEPRGQRAVPANRCHPDLSLTPCHRRTGSG